MLFDLLMEARTIKRMSPGYGAKEGQEGRNGEQNSKPPKYRLK
jgi:hypothetical protein